MSFAFDAVAIRPEELTADKTEWLIEGFLVKEAITMIYGAPSQGKTWMMYALARHLVEESKCKRLYYLDMDNPKRQLKDRRVDELLLCFESVRYITKSKLAYAPAQLVEAIAKEAYGRNFEDMVFIFDSVQDFVDTKNDRAARLFMERMKGIREAGATVLLLHHATKSGKVIDGSAAFVRSSDNVFELRQKMRTAATIHYALLVENDRDPICDMAFRVDTARFALKEDASSFADMDAAQEEFVRAVCAVLAKEPMNQSKLFALLGKSRDDKTARKWLENYTGRFWEYKTKGKAKIYHLKGDV